MMCRTRLENGDQELFERVWYAARDREVDVGVNLRRLNKPGSPVFSSIDNGVPLLVILVAVIAAAVAGGILWGVAILASGAILFLTVINIWVMGRLRQRTLTRALSSPTEWQTLWDLGGLSLRSLRDRNLEAESENDDDWRRFARRHLRKPAGGT